MKMERRTFWVVTVTTIASFGAWIAGGNLWLFLLAVLFNTVNVALSIGGNR